MSRLFVLSQIEKVLPDYDKDPETHRETLKSLIAKLNPGYNNTGLIFNHPWSEHWHTYGYPMALLPEVLKFGSSHHEYSSDDYYMWVFTNPVTRMCFLYGSKWLEPISDSWPKLFADIPYAPSYESMLQELQRLKLA